MIGIRHLLLIIFAGMEFSEAVLAIFCKLFDDITYTLFKYRETTAAELQCRKFNAIQIRYTLQTKVVQ